MGKTSSLKHIPEQIKILEKNKKIRLVITMCAVLLSAFIQAWAIQVFVRPAQIISGGFSGAAMLIERVGSLNGLTIPMQVTMILLNIPVALMCCRGISVRFTVVSLLQVAFGSMFLQIFSFQPIFTDEILNVIFGGVIYGTSIVIALRGNASTGGTDFIALFVSNKTGKIYLELCILWKCTDVLCVRCDLWLEICRIFHYFPVYIHSYDLRFPSPL